MRAPAARLGAAWMEDNDIRDATTKIRQNRKRHDALIRSLGNKLAVHADSVERSLKDVGGLPGSKAIVKRAVSGRRREFARETADTRKAMIRELTETAAVVRSAATHYASPMQMLMRGSLGSERRSRLMQQVEASGPVELASLAEYAAAKGDGELAAALCSRVSGMKVADRPFSPSDLADVICGERHREISQALVECERRALEALQADTEFETGEANKQRAVEIAMLRRRETEIGAYEPEDD